MYRTRPWASFIRYTPGVSGRALRRDRSLVSSTLAPILSESAKHCFADGPKKGRITRVRMSEIDPSEESVREAMDRHVAAYRAGEDPDLSRILDALWDALYARIPTLTASKDKDTQHDILKAYLVRLGFPDVPDLQY